MLARLVPMFVCLVLSACATTPPCKVQPQAPKRVQPVECLTPVEIGQCHLSIAFDNASLEDQAAELLNCEIVNGAAALEAEKKRACLADWVKAE